MSFEHLDDDQPFIPTAAFRQSVETRGAGLARRRGAARVLATVAVATVVLAGTAGALAWREVDGVQRVDTADALTPAPGTDDAFTVLVAGTDGTASEPVAARTDALILVRFDVPQDRVSVVSIPRDLAVEIEDGHARVNDLLGQGGPALLIDTLEAELGVTVNHYVEIDVSFVERLAELGPVELDFARDVRDESTGLYAAAGCRVLDGQQLVALVRSRHLEYRDEQGSWQRAPSEGDLGRIDRQQVVLRQLLGTLHDLPSDPIQLGVAANELLDAARVDTTFSSTDILRLVMWLQGLPADAMQVATLEVVPGVLEGGASVLVLAGPVSPGGLFEGIDHAEDPVSVPLVDVCEQ
jgi:LCP family protein required for cell wall assembly